VGTLFLVGGSIAANYQNGGIAWERLSWVLGLRRLGLDVWMLDQLDRARCVCPDGVEQGYDGCLNRGYFENVIKEFGLADSAILIGDRGESLYGPEYGELLELADSVDLLVNVAGNVRLEEVKRRTRLTAFVDVDPGLTQLWLASGAPSPRIEGHDLHFTIGENVGTPACPLPTGGVEWRHTRQPVLLDEWPVAAGGRPDRFTTVARWRGTGPHGSLDLRGISLTQKADEFEKVIELPKRAAGTFEIALNIDRTDAEGRSLLERNGWRLVNPLGVSADPGSFRAYVQSSGAEFSVAKGAYAETQSGWFSDRTTRYLASGKPAVVQDTGFRCNIPVGDGLLSFRNIDEAIGAVETIAADYAHHSAAARVLAEQCFDSEKVLTRFLDDVESAQTSQNKRFNHPHRGRLGRKGQ
jgi:hypothetical protein